MGAGNSGTPLEVLGLPSSLKTLTGDLSDSHWAFPFLQTPMMSLWLFFLSFFE
jgi:hypothetical protein